MSETFAEVSLLRDWVGCEQTTTTTRLSRTPGLAMESCDEVMPSREDEALAALKASPLVRDVGLNSGAKKGVNARLWCARTEHPKRDSEQLNITNLHKYAHHYCSVRGGAPRARQQEAQLSSGSS